jgi:hypothetical protein
MKKLIFILLLLPSLVIAQTQTYSLNGMLNIGNRAGYLIGTKGEYKSKDTGKLGLITTASGQIQYASVNDVMVLQRRDGNLSVYGWKTLDKVQSLILFSEGEHSYTRKVDVRVTGGVGYKRALVDLPGKKLEVSQAVTTEQLQLIDGNCTWTVRSSTRGKLVLGTLTKLTIIANLQPPLASNTGADVRNNMVGRVIAQLEHPLSKSLSFSIGGDINYQTYQSWVKPEVKPYDGVIQLGLVWKPNK